MDGSEEDSGWDRSFASRASGGGGGGGKVFRIPDHQTQSDNDQPVRPFTSTLIAPRKLADVRGVAGEISLREWLGRPGRPVDMLESLHIFQQVVEAVGLAHAQGVAVTNVRPSCFVLSSFNRVSFIESASCSSSGSDFYRGEDSRTETASHASCFRYFPGHNARASSMEEVCKRNPVVKDSKDFPLKRLLDMELEWYTTPEEAAGCGTAASAVTADIYRLGVLLFELFCMFDTFEEKLMVMADLRHRVLPPQMLLKWPKVASFCLWLLHPQPSSRPKMSEVVQSEFLNETREHLEEREAAIRLKEEIEDQELLLEFLFQLQQKKQETVNKLHDTICFLSTDMEEVANRLSMSKEKGDSYSELDKPEHFEVEKVDLPLFLSGISENSDCSAARKRLRPGVKDCDKENITEILAKSPLSEMHPEVQENILFKSTRLMKNFEKLESAYFSTRCSRLMKTGGKLTHKKLTTSNTDRGSTAKTEGSSIDDLVSKEGYSAGSRSEWIDPFLEGLCKYLSYSRLKVRGDLKQGDLLNSSNLVCSLGFDRDREFFATAGVNKKIKIFECDMILNDDRDIHYPVVELASRSKLSNICWNGYIKSQIASSDFEGVVQVWDVTRSQVVAKMREHERRVWSIDFSLTDPTKLASGSDDGAVKLWNINQVGSICTIRTKANVCSVQFPPDSGHSLAIGSADHKIYLYDLRNVRMPCSTLVGHSKTVSYVKFVDSSNMVSASTDNSLKLWGFSTNSLRVLDCPLRTFTGHTNVKNFVGLSVSDGYIATGSETNEVFVYHKAFPMPLLSYKFSTDDPVTGREVDDATQFISCVCWRGQSSILLAANSSGNIKLLEMV